MKTGHKIMTQKFTKNISPIPCHIIYSHVQTIWYSSVPPSLRMRQMWWISQLA